MKKYILLPLFAFAFVSISNAVFADDHGDSLPSGFNVQLQLCKLNDGATLSQYNKMNADYIKWSKKNDVEVTFIRQTPLFSHDDFIQSSGYDFLEILASPFALSGKAWDKWLSTKEGQKLNKEWNNLATCHVKMGGGRMLWGDEEALNSDSERYVTWNWCSINDGVQVEEVIKEHARLVELVKENPQGMIGWFGLVPRLGGANAPGDFAHIAVFPDLESAMKRQESLSEGGWIGYRDYQRDFATCRGEQLLSEQVIHRPGE